MSAERAAAPVLLALNAGSSSIKLALFEVVEDAPRLALRGQIAGIGTRPRFAARDATGAPLAVPEIERKLAAGGIGHGEALACLLDWIDGAGLGERLIAAGHRVVHGGLDRTAPTLIDRAELRALAALAPLAPAHQGHNIAAIEALAARRPGLPQIACFDTAFHARQPAVARRIALPRRYAERGLWRYGFHGLSYEYIVAALPEISGEALPERLVVAHLGNGASMCAIRAGRSIATTMGFSTLDGLPMGTRSGSVDPGALLYLMREEGLDADALAALLYEQSGLLGVSEISGDMATLLASDDPRAAEAVELFVYRIGRLLGSLAAALGGLDALVFTGGIGENAAPVRAAVCEGAGWLGLVLDPAANAAGGPRISTPASRVAAWVVPTDEELMVARHVLAVIGRAAS